MRVLIPASAHLSAVLRIAPVCRVTEFNLDAQSLRRSQRSPQINQQAGQRGRTSLDTRWEFDPNTVRRGVCWGGLAAWEAEQRCQRQNKGVGRTKESGTVYGQIMLEQLVKVPDSFISPPLYFPPGSTSTVLHRANRRGVSDLR